MPRGEPRPGYPKTVPVKATRRARLFLRDRIRYAENKIKEGETISNEFRVVEKFHLRCSISGGSSERARAEPPINLDVSHQRIRPSGDILTGLKKRSDSDRCEDSARCIFNTPFISR